METSTRPRTRITTFTTLVGLMLATWGAFQGAAAAIPLLNGVPATQNFDVLGTVQAATLPSDFRADRPAGVRTLGTWAAAGTVTTQYAGNNMSGTAANGIYNYGAGVYNVATDRALGFLSSGTGTQSGNVYAQYLNDTGSPDPGLAISYGVEKYRTGSNASGFRVQMYYSLDGTGWTSAGPAFLTSFPADASNSGYASAPGVTVPVSGTLTVPGLAVGGTLYLAWNYSVTSGSTVTNAQGLGIDDVSVTATGAGAPHAPTLETVEWSMLGSSEVRFHLRWANPDATSPSEPSSGSISSQPFGAFLPDFGSIGGFSVPPILPGSFFDVYFDVPLGALPPTATKVLPDGGPPLGWPCPADTIWAGNVDVLWDSLGIQVHVNKHLANLLVNPGVGPSLIHLVTNCAMPAPWAIAGLCNGFNATLLNEDLSAAPNPLPAGWTGFISVSSPAGTPAGQVCCFGVVLTCNGVPGVIQVCATTCIWPGPHGPTLDSLDWSMVGTDVVRFHLRWTDPDPESPSRAASGTLGSQEFGAFLPDFGTIGTFDVPPIEPESFFDVYFDVPLGSLPPPPEKVLPGGGPPLGWPCPRDTVWAGNVDVLWDSAGSPASVQWHWTQVLVNPGVGASLIHVVTGCGVPAPWAIVGLCNGFNATLVNEDKTTPAPNPLPAGWTGYILVSSPAGTAGGLVCCFQVVLTCNGVPGVLRVCATTCVWPGPHAPTLDTVEWSMLTSSEVRFHLRWSNPDPDTPSEATSGTLGSQAFGAFLPDFGSIGVFDVPPIEPESFFDVYFEVPLGSLPPPPEKVLPGGGPPLGWPCPRDTVWIGNVDVVWDSLGVPVQVNRHFGNVLVNPGVGPSLIHVVTGCGVPAPWAIVGLCNGFNATLVNEDKATPAPNPLPAGWTGYILVSSPAGTAGGLVCCFQVVLTCNGVPGVIQVCATTCVWPGPHAPTLDTVEWSMLTSSEVRFHLRWSNPDPDTPSEATSGTLSSQAFGAFLPDFGTIGTFDVPPIEAESFFDVFFDVSVASLPPPPQKVLPDGGPPPGWPCPPDTVWAGNVDVVWDSLGVPVNVWKHFANLLVNPGKGPSLIHVVTNCPVPAPWAVIGLCAGFNVALLNEDLSPAANPLPANWTGFIAVSSPAGTAGGLVCCFQVVLTCNGVPGVIQVCATTCVWPVTGVEPGTGVDFGIRTVAPNPTSGTATITFGLPRSTAVRMSLIDVSGKRVRTLIEGERPAGLQTYVWDGRAGSGQPLPAGVYFLTLKAEGRTATRTVVLLR